MKIGKETGSLVNALIVNNCVHEPILGEDVTECLWTDRHAWRVIAVDEDKKGAVLARYIPRQVGNYYEQTYKYEDENGNLLLDNSYIMHVRYRYKAWRANGAKVHLAWGRRDEYEDPCF